MELYQLKTFATVASTGHLTKAAEQLFISQPAVSAQLKPLLLLVKKLALDPVNVSQSDADAVFAAGWDEAAYHSAVAVTARMTFMSKIIHGHGFIPMSPERARVNAEHRAKAGYVALYPKLGNTGGTAS